MLLTISIPTYNRSNYLATCLGSIVSQIQENGELKNKIELIISDNCSADDTQTVINHFVAGYPDINIKAHANDKNIGLDGNITKAFDLANGDFVLVFGDDDVLIPGALNKIVNIIEQNPQCGNLYINHYGFSDKIEDNRPDHISNTYVVYNDFEEYFKLVSYYFTYTSGNIINKKALDDTFKLNRFLGTNLNLLNWIFSSVKAAPYNIYIHDKLIGMKLDNTGGYGFCETFAINGNKVFDHYISQGWPKKVFKRVNNDMLRAFFPNLIVLFKNTSGNFFKEDYLIILKQVYKSNIRFWLFCYPVIKLSTQFSKVYMIGVKIYNKLHAMYRSKVSNPSLKRSKKLVVKNL